MHTIVPFASAIFLVISCSSVWSQPNQMIASDGADELLRPRLQLYDWRVPTSPPELQCPKGASQQKKFVGKSWHTWCARGEKNHGPSHSFNLNSREHVVTEYYEGARHGWSIRVHVRPALELQNRSRNGNHWRFGELDRLRELTDELKTWLPSSTARPIRCPEGASSHIEWLSNEVFVVECQRPDGSRHGLHKQVQLSYGRETREVYENGVAVGPKMVIDDQRASEETLYDRGRFIRRLSWSKVGLQTLETRRRDKRAMVRFHKGGVPASLVRFKGDKRHGEALAWHENGQRAQRVEYRAGEVQGTIKKWDKKGNLIEIRRMVAGTGEVERINPGRSNEKTLCVYRQGQKVSCKTTDANGGLLEEDYFVNGQLSRARSWWRAGGTLRTDYVRSADNPEHTVQKNYESSGQLSQIGECYGSRCTTTRYDREGKAEIVHPRGMPERKELQRLLGDML